MASTHTVELRIEKITTGEQSGTWGTSTNTQYDLWESAISGTTTVAFASDANDTLTTANGSDDEARHMFLKLSGGATLSATREMVVPTSSKLYFVYNGTTGSQSVTIIGASGSGITVPNGAYMCLYHNGTNVINAFNNINITGGTVTGITDLVVADGGTGVSTLTDGGLLLGSGTGAITAMAVLADGAMVVGDGTTDPVAESGATLRTSIGVGTADSPQFTGIELGHASDTTLTKNASAGDMDIEGNIVYRAGGTDVPLTDGGTGSSTAGGARTNLGLGTGDKPAFAGATLSADLTFSGADPEVQGGDTNGVLIISPNTNSLGAVVKQYGDTHTSKAGDFEFYDDTTLVANYDASASKWFFKGIDYTIFDIAGHYGDELDDGLTPIEIISNTGFAFTIDSITYKLSAGAITVDLQIAGSSVTSLNALSVTTSETSTSASGANAVAAGVDVRMVITNMTTGDRNFSFTIHCTRTS